MFAHFNLLSIFKELGISYIPLRNMNTIDTYDGTKNEINITSITKRVSNEFYAIALSFCVKLSGSKLYRLLQSRFFS